MEMEGMGGEKLRYHRAMNVSAKTGQNGGEQKTLRVILGRVGARLTIIETGRDKRKLLRKAWKDL